MSANGFTVIKEHAPQLEKEKQAFCVELVLWALTIKSKLNKAENNTSLKVDSIGLNQFLYGDNYQINYKGFLSFFCFALNFIAAFILSEALILSAL